MSIDLFDTASLLSEEELMVKENVSRFVRENVKPIIQEHFEQHRFPSDLIQSDFCPSDLIPSDFPSMILGFPSMKWGFSSMKWRNRR